MSIDQLLRPFQDYGAQPDSPLEAQDESEMARRTSALIYGGVNTCRSWFWESPGGFGLHGTAMSVPPWATIVTADTWTNFMVGDINDTQILGLPWRRSEGCAQTWFGATIGAEHDVHLAFRVRAVALLDAMTTVNGDATPHYVMPRAAVEMAAWVYMSLWGQVGMRTVDVESMINTVAELPANRRFLLCPQVKMTYPSHPVLQSAELSVIVYMHNARAIDIGNATAMDVPGA